MKENISCLLEAEEYERLRVEHRQAVAIEWLEAASKVAEDSGLDLALEVADYLNNRAGLGIVEQEGFSRKFYFLKPGIEPSDCFFITPVLESDNNYVSHHRTKSGGFTNEAGAKVRASFHHSNRVLYFNDNLDASEVGKGLVLLHEAVHVITEIEGLVNRSFYPNQFWLEEAEAYQFEYQILNALGGQVYAALVERIKAEIGADGDGIICNYQFTKADFEVLNQIFGEQVSESELEHWAGVIINNTWLEYFKQHNGRPLVQFAAFLAWQGGSWMT